MVQFLTFSSDFNFLTAPEYFSPRSGWITIEPNKAWRFRCTSVFHKNQFKFSSHRNMISRRVYATVGLCWEKRIFKPCTATYLVSIWFLLRSPRLFQELSSYFSFVYYICKVRPSLKKKEKCNSIFVVDRFRDLNEHKQDRDQALVSVGGSCKPWLLLNVW